jgi:molybdopterin synthase catalytic subunit
MGETDNIFVAGPISPAYITEVIAAFAARTELGAHSIFLGQVRDDEKEEGRVAVIDYTTYEEMAREKAAEMVAEIMHQFSLSQIHLRHSVGLVPAGGISLFVLAASKHRQSAIAACAALVERLKKELPVWGQEITDQHQANWKENT